MATFTLIASTTVGAGGASSIDFTSIPATYTDLKLVMSARQDQTFSNDGNAVSIQFNSGGTGSFSGKYLIGTGSSAVSASPYLNTLYYGSDPSDYTASTFSNIELYIPNYAGSNNKSFSLDSVYENNATAARAGFQAGLWSNTNAITSISISPFTGGGKFVQYTTAYLYGIKNS